MVINLNILTKEIKKHIWLIGEFKDENFNL